MIVTSAPLRVSFFGGGSDIKNYYSDFGGAFLSMAINKRIYIVLNSSKNADIKLNYSKTEIVSDALDIKHPLIRECFLEYNLGTGIEIGSFAPISTHGSGLGSSSSFTVALIGAVKEHLCASYNNRELAEAACHIEINRCSEPIGKQDQYAASFGGLNFYSINRDGNVSVESNIVTREIENILEASLYLVGTGKSRKTGDILSDQNINISKSLHAKHAQHIIVEHAHTAKSFLLNGELDKFGLLLNEVWNLKRKLSNKISDAQIDAIYKKGLEEGALGGKLLGAGGGGYVLFYVPKAARKKFECAFSDNFMTVKIDQRGFHFDFKG